MVNRRVRFLKRSFFSARQLLRLVCLIAQALLDWRLVDGLSTLRPRVRLDFVRFPIHGGCRSSVVHNGVQD
ncbi:hypothetical protein DL96DRAFT_217232 [Flagelloscypha sp. PMI_526]|nr:hypothetical protein DL96DRAFT_217232 [Flagelloscypha sp. PMI_526]